MDTPVGGGSTAGSEPSTLGCCPGAAPIGSPLPTVGWPPWAPFAVPPGPWPPCSSRWADVPLVGLQSSVDPAWALPASLPWAAPAGPSGEPRAGPHTLLCQTGPPPQGPPRWGQLLGWSQLRTRCPPASSPQPGSLHPEPPARCAGSPRPQRRLLRGLHHPHALALSWLEFASSGSQLQPLDWMRNLQPPPPSSGTD